MTAHLHVGFADFVIFTLYLLIAMFFLKYVSTRMSETSFGKALAYILD